MNFKNIIKKLKTILSSKPSRYDGVSVTILEDFVMLKAHDYKFVDRSKKLSQISKQWNLIHHGQSGAIRQILTKGKLTVYWTEKEVQEEIKNIKLITNVKLKYKLIVKDNTPEHYLIEIIDFK